MILVRDGVYVTNDRLRYIILDRLLGMDFSENVVGTQCFPVTRVGNTSMSLGFLGQSVVAALP